MPILVVARKHAGFSLAEMSVVLVIVALLAGGMVFSLSTQTELRRVDETMKRLEYARSALMGFVLANHYFPCPAVSATAGQEDRNAEGQCNKRQGFIPWISLGIPADDAWGRLVRYSVTPGYADALTHFTYATQADIVIQTRSLDNTVENLTSSSGYKIPAVLWSTGKNGHWGVLASGNGSVMSDSINQNRDEDLNANAFNLSGGKKFVARPASQAGSAYGEFDDLVIWISPFVLFAQQASSPR